MPCDIPKSSRVTTCLPGCGTDADCGGVAEGVPFVCEHLYDTTLPNYDTTLPDILPGLVLAVLVLILKPLT